MNANDGCLACDVALDPFDTGFIRFTAYDVIDSRPT